MFWVCKCSCVELDDVKIYLLIGLIQTVNKIKATQKAVYPIGWREEMMRFV